jgi:hypothetical protein
MIKTKEQKADRFIFYDRSLSISSKLLLSP